MNDSPETPGTEADRPVDPAVVAASVLEARRRLVASQGIVRMILGLAFFVAFAIVRGATAYKTEPHMQAVCLLVVAFIAMAILLPPIVTRLRRRCGITVVSLAEAQMVRFFSHPGWLALLAFLGVWAVYLVVAAMIGLGRWQVPSAHVHAFDTAVALCSTGAVVALYLARSLRVRMWEDLIMAAGMCVAGLFFALLRERVRLEIIVMLAAIGAFASGLALHFRWREYVRRMPKEVTP